MLLEIQTKLRQMKIVKWINRLPITVKVTAWYTMFLLILIMGLVGASFFVTYRYASSLSEFELKKAVNDITSERKSYEPYDEGILLLLYDSQGDLVEGKIPTAFKGESNFSEDTIREYSSMQNQFIYFDKRIASGKYKNSWVRGVASITGLKLKLSLVSIFLLIISPIMLIVIALGGYTIIKLAFKPVKKISQAAIEIGNNYDLSKRIELDEGDDEVHQMAYAFNEMLSALEVASEHEKQFTSNVSHEIRTPLSVILTESQYGEEHIESIEEAKKSFQVISRQSKRMSRLVNQLLEISKMDRTTKVEKAEFNLSDMLKSMILDYKSFADAKGLSLTDKIESDIYIYGNKMMIQRVFDNLFTNALKFTTSQIVISLRKDHQRCYLSVEDNGSGIPEEIQDRIWERFYQAESSRNKESNNGFGLGLAMIKQIMKLHNGESTVESKEGLGSIFTVSFYMISK